MCYCYCHLHYDLTWHIFLNSPTWNSFYVTDIICDDHLREFWIISHIKLLRFTSNLFYESSNFNRIFNENQNVKYIIDKHCWKTSSYILYLRWVNCSYLKFPSSHLDLSPFSLGLRLQLEIRNPQGHQENDFQNIRNVFCTSTKTLSAWFLFIGDWLWLNQF